MMVTDYIKDEEKQEFLSLFLTPETEAILPTVQMVEILSLDYNQILPIPDTSKEVIGVFNWRQQILWVVDLPALLWLPPLYEKRSLKSNVVVIKNQEQKLAIAVYDIGEIISYKPEENSLILEPKTIFKLINNYG